MNPTETASPAAPRAKLEELRLCMIAGVGPRTRQSLLQQFGTAEGVFAANLDALQQVAGVGPKLAARIAKAPAEIAVEREVELARQLGCRLLFESDPGYPALLAELADPPGILYLQGELTEADKYCVAVVGSRHGTRYGIAQAERLAASLARAGLTVVSGLARGIDAAAHRAALEAGGRTIAVLGSGLARIYPPEHRGLAGEIAKQGCVISEMPLRFAPLAGAFPQRNRIISGLSMGVLVVEAALRSGALSTARHATEQNREVFAIPGPIDNAMSQGCHRLLKDGAKLVENVEDILEELTQWSPLLQAAPQTPVERPAARQLEGEESIVFSTLGASPTSIDAIIAATGLPPHRVLAHLGTLEIRRLVRRVEGNRIERL